jgi:ABC-type transport system involved in cytochrome c biogenesis permease subunit
VSVSRLRLGEWVALVGAVGLLVVMFLDWFGLEEGAGGPAVSAGLRDLAARLLEKSGWSGLGWAAVALVVLLIAGGLAIAATTALRQTPAWVVGASVLSVAAGIVAVFVLALRILLFQPDLGAGLPNDLVDVRLPALLGLLFAALVPLGAWLALDDERVDAPESAYTPPPARPVPGTPST